LLRAAIDVGTNSVLALVAELDEQAGRRQLRVRWEEEVLTRLGEGVAETGSLAPQAVRRTAEAVASLAGHCRKLGAEDIVIAATSAARDAGNFEVFRQAVYERTGLPVRVLSGQEEAYAAFRGARAGHPEVDGSCLVIDVGGGSTELVYGHDEPRSWTSLNIGSVRLKEQWLRHDPFTAEEWTQLCHRIQQALLSALWEMPRPVEVAIGVGGTVTTLAMLEAGLPRYEAQQIHGMPLAARSIEAWASKLAQMTYKERTGLPGVAPLRGDVLPVGAQILAETLRAFGLQSLLVSTFGIRHGLLLE
jgi:exopolyphosphatase/guanosine-5'-triphosphate,3'-diphosphate pyrophosphatase